MKRFLICLAIVFVGFMSILASGCSRSEEFVEQSEARTQSEYERGKADAVADLKTARPRYFRTGKPLSADSKLPQILNDEYGVKLVGLGCVAVPPVAEHAKGYNEVVLKELNHRFGKDIIQAAWQKDVKQRERGIEKGTNKAMNADK